jgi:hypothetical protein
MMRSIGKHSGYLEVASVDENNNPRLFLWDFDFSVVWEQENMASLIGEIWYHDGTTQTWPFIANVLNPAGPGQICPSVSTDDCSEPDIAATQDYQPWWAEIYYFHVDWVRENTSTGNFFIESCYAVGRASLPGAAAFVMVAAPAQGPTPWPLDNPTIASKLRVGPFFETWMAWEDSTNRTATNPDIWFRVGTYTVGAPPFVYTVGPGRVGYLPGAGGGTTEYNPELWNRNEQLRLFPPLTHLVFDTSIGLAGNQEVEYIDP